MTSARERIFRRARGLRRSRALCIDTDIPPVPPLPTDLPASPATISSTISSPMSLPLPETNFFHPHSQHYLHGNHSHEFSRHISTSSRVSQSSSCWSSASSSASTLSLSSAASHGFSPLRMHPSTVPTGLYFNDDGLPELLNSASTTSAHEHGFDFGFMAKPRTAGPTIRLVQPSCKRYMLDFEDDEDDDDLFDDFEYVNTDDDDTHFSTGLSPPPHQTRMRAPQSEADLHHPARPATPTAKAPVSAPTSPVRPRVQAGDGSDMDRLIKRGDWKRRGIVFGIQEA